MAKARVIAKRRKAVQNIRKITRTMQLIATAKFQAAFNRATASRPYTEHITKLVEQLSRDQGELDHPLLRANTESKRAALLVLTSNRGLCGGYNSSLLRTAGEQLKALESNGQTVDLHVVGKKGAAYFKFHGRQPASSQTGLADHPTFAEVERMASKMIEAYERKELDSVDVAYTRFASTGSQYPEVLRMLPVARPGIARGEAETGELAGREGVAAEPPVQYEFSPPAAELLAELLPEMVRVRLFQCFMDAAVSEHTARMVAMKAATDAAEEMIKTLTRKFNRARQTQITLELLDIVAGAEAQA